jgi:deazaflavin-dependent oxidoreductase (nitroreductase family)
LLRPPAGYGVLTTTGRRSGKRRQRCVRAIRRGERAYLVAIKGNRTAWLKNVRANPQVRLHLRGGTFAGKARELRDAAETEAALSAYCEAAGSFEYLECMMWRSGRPSRSKAVELHRHWFESGIPLVVELSR